MGAISRIGRRLPLLLAGTALLMFGGIDPLLHSSGLGSYVDATSAKDGDGGSGKGGGESGGRSGGDDGGHSSDSSSDYGRGDDDGSSNSGSGRSSRERHDDSRRKEARDVQRYLNLATKRGTVVWSRVGPGSAELRYSDGWAESVKGGRYSLRDRTNRVVTERPAKPSDLKRLSTASANSR